MATCNCKDNTDVQYDYVILPTVVKLPLFGQVVATRGFHCTLSITVNTNYDFGYYSIGIQNAVGQARKEIKIVNKGDFYVRRSLINYQELLKLSIYFRVFVF